MDAKRLFQQIETGFKETDIWHCSKCGILYGDRNLGRQKAREAAEACCRPVLCACGKECHRHYTACDECQAKARKAKTAARIHAATKIAEWDGWVCDPQEGGPQEGYFESIYAMLEWYEDEGETPPEFAFLTTEVPFRLDLSACIDDALQDHHEDARESLTGEDEIIEAVRIWAESQSLKSYQVDYSRVIKLPTEPAGAGEKGKEA